MLFLWSGWNSLALWGMLAAWWHHRSVIWRCGVVESISSSIHSEKLVYQSGHTSSEADALFANVYCHKNRTNCNWNPLLFNVPKFKSVLHLTFSFSDSTPIMWVLKFLHLRFSKVWCSNQVLLEEALDEGFTVNTLTVLNPTCAKCLQKWLHLTVYDSFRHFILIE
jgi:hypothetical protein